MRRPASSRWSWTTHGKASGVGTALMQALIARAREKGLRRMYGEILAQNGKMLDLARALGFGIARHAEDGTLRTATLALNAEAANA